MNNIWLMFWKKKFSKYYKANTLKKQCRYFEKIYIYILYMYLINLINVVAIIAVQLSLMRIYITKHEDRLLYFNMAS